MGRLSEGRQVAQSPRAIGVTVQIAILVVLFGWDRLSPNSMLDKKKLAE